MVRVRLYDCDICGATRGINSIAKLAKSNKNGAREMAYDSFVGGGDGDYNGTGCAKMSKLSAKLDAFSLGNKQFVRVER